jgi:hypothetical protein
MSPLGTSSLAPSFCVAWCPATLGSIRQENQRTLRAPISHFFPRFPTLEDVFASVNSQTPLFRDMTMTYKANRSPFNGKNTIENQC